VMVNVILALDGWRGPAVQWHPLGNRSLSQIRNLHEPAWRLARTLSA
jgi:hypothetical protein